MSKHVAMSLGDPPKPVEDADLTNVCFFDLDPIETAEFVVS